VIPRTLLVRIAPWWVLLVIIGSFLPATSKEAIGTLNTPEAATAGRAVARHRIAHFLTFGSTALLLVLISETAAQEIWAGFAVAALGFILECSQFALIGLTEMEWWDVRDDALAAVAVLLIAQWFGLREKLVQK
jgi:hypothetical protein